MNCIAVIEPRKKTVGTASAWTANQRNVKIGYVKVLEVAIIFLSLKSLHQGSSILPSGKLWKRKPSLSFLPIDIGVDLEAQNLFEKLFIKKLFIE